MKINSTLEKKLLKYSAMATGVVALGNTANAQITYFDESPDVVLTGHQAAAAFDFDGDLINDIFVITLDGTQTGTLQSIPFTLYYKGAVAVGYSGAGIMSFQSNGYPYAQMLNANDPINSSGAFLSGATPPTQANQANMAIEGTAVTSIGNYPISAGNWAGAVDKYLGFRFTSSGNLHYGWMRIDVDATVTTVTIKDWAYNTVADEVISAGATTSTVGLESIADELALFRFGNNQVEIKAIKGSNGNITIYDMEGKTVYNATMNSSYETISLADFTSGIYIVNAQFSEGVISKKVFVK